VIAGRQQFFEPIVTTGPWGKRSVRGVGMHPRRTHWSSRRFRSALAVRDPPFENSRRRLQITGVSEPLDALFEPLFAGRIGEPRVARRPERAARDRRDVGVLEGALTPRLVVVIAFWPGTTAVSELDDDVDRGDLKRNG
jgi:hypothetical protein